MEKAIKSYIDYIKYVKRFSDKTIISYHCDLNHFLNYVINKEIKFEDLKPSDIFQLHNVEKVMNGNEDIIYKQDRLVADECGYNTLPHWAKQ